MKKSLFFLLIIGIASVFTFTSCLNDDDDNGAASRILTLDEQYQQQAAMKGTYFGKTRLYYPGTNNNIVKYDSVKVTSWTVRTDSTITLNTFPVCKLDSAINVKKTDLSPTANTMRALQQAIKNCEALVNIKCYYCIPTWGYITDTQKMFFVAPMVISQTLNYEGEDHKVDFIFDNNSFGGTYTKTTGDAKFEFSMCLTHIGIDKQGTSYKTLLQAGRDNYYFQQILITNNAN